MLLVRIIENIIILGQVRLSKGQCLPQGLEIGKILPPITNPRSSIKPGSAPDPNVISRKLRAELDRSLESNEDGNGWSDILEKVKSMHFWHFKEYI